MLEKPENPSFSMVFGPSGRDHGPQKTIILDFGVHQMIQNNSRKSRIVFDKHIFKHIKILQIESLESSEKTRAGNPEDPSYKFLKSLNMGSISINKNMNWQFCNVQLNEYFNFMFIFY